MIIVRVYCLPFVPTMINLPNEYQCIEHVPSRFDVCVRSRAKDWCCDKSDDIKSDIIVKDTENKTQKLL